jgi:FAD binding domain/Berberine and berberine like
MTLTAERTRTDSLARPDERDIAALRARVAGRIVLPGDPDWDDARRAWNLAVDQHPFAVALVESAADVVETVAFARLHGLRIAPQGTGHGATALSLGDDTILVKTSRLRGVEIDASARRARVEAGAIWADVVEPAAEQGFVVLHGSSPDVGVVGYSLGGGMGWLARSRGLAANSVTEVEIVTADGRLVRADREHEPDLFWAVRGGGGSFGVVTAIELELFDAPPLYSGAMFWPVERAGEVLRAWREWAETVPAEVTSVGRILHLPPVPDIPEPLRGGSFAVVEAVFTGPASEGAELVRPLRALEPLIDTFAPVSPTALQHLHMDPPKPVPGIGDGMFLDDLPVEAIDAIVETGVPPLLTLEIRQLGGAMATPSASNGAVGSLDAAYVMFTAGLAMTPELGAAVAGAVDCVKAALVPWESRRAYFNFAEREVDVARLYTAETYKRLRRIKDAYDPGELFVANHAIPPAHRTLIAPAVLQQWTPMSKEAR